MVPIRGKPSSRQFLLCCWMRLGDLKTCWSPVLAFIAPLTSYFSGFTPCKWSDSSAGVWHESHWAKVKISTGPHSFLDTRGENQFPCLFQLPASHTPWFAHGPLSPSPKPATSHLSWTLFRCQHCFPSDHSLERFSAFKGLMWLDWAHLDNPG